MITTLPDIVALDQVDSTNAEALRMVGRGVRPPFWVRADRQTAGRGRRGRAWVPVEGNLYASLAMSASDAGTAALRSFVAALALSDALIATGVAPERITLKWPNDVLVEGRKIAGILLESTNRPAGLILVVGIGVNLAGRPDLADLDTGAVPPVALSDIGSGMTPDIFLDHLAPAFARREAEFHDVGFEKTRAAWIAQAARLGERITARLPDRVLTGTFRDIDMDGALVLDTGQGKPELLHAADIHL